MKKVERKKWKAFAGIVLILQAVFGIFLLAMIVKINMLPIEYMLFITILLFFMFTCSYLLLFARKKKGKSKKVVYVKRGFGSVLSVLVMVVCLLGTSVISKLDLTIQNISGNDVITETTAVYVLKDDSAQELSDIKDYTLGYAQSFVWGDGQKTLESVRASLDGELETEAFNSVDDMIGAL